MNITGLILDLIGVVGLFAYGLPAKYNKDGELYKGISGYDEIRAKERAGYINTKHKSYVSLASIFIGFSLQILSMANFVPSISENEAPNTYSNECYYCCCCNCDHP